MKNHAASRTVIRLFLSWAILLCGVAHVSAQSLSELEQQVTDRERAFAKTMADRDHAAFASFLADDAIFLGPDRALRGRKEVADGWKGFYDAPQPPFAWAPERVHVVESGTLAISTGPVTDLQGRRIGTFTSTWRRDKDGRWLIVLDSGCPPCPCK